MARRALLPLSIFALCVAVYVALLAAPVLAPSPNNHFVHLARSFLHGQLSVVGNRPPGTNDWALYRGTWYVSFPCLPAVVIAPLVALLGLATPDRLFWAVLAGASPALLFVVLRSLSERGFSARATRDNLLLTGLFAFGTVFFFVAVQGSVWFAAHVLASVLIPLYLLCALEAARPLRAGLVLGLLLLTRPTTLLLGLLFALEALRVHGLARPRELLKTCASFALPVLACAAIQLWMNDARFDHPLSFGHEYLQIRWQARIAKWGLFNYHYLSKNLAVMLSGLPWLSDTAPYVKISEHGLALWVTTPGLLWVLWPRVMDARMRGLYIAASAVLLLNLCYQNSGWIQFGYRFVLDCLPLFFVLLALGQRPLGVAFHACAVLALVINTFGALTFDKRRQYYDNDTTQNRLFQPD